MQIADRVFLVTGGGSGLGEATARELVSAGGRVVLGDIDSAAVERVVADCGDRAAGAVMDILSSEQVTAGIDDARRRWGRFDGAVHCAGIIGASRIVGRQGPHDLDLFRRIIDVNLVGTFNVLRLAAAALATNEAEGERGVVVLTSSIAAEDGQIGQAAYAAAKGGVSSLALPAARELAKSRIRVVAIAPGVFDTHLMAGVSPEVVAALTAAAPYPPRFGRPVEFARFARHIIENEYFNGSVLRLDAGMRMPP